MNADHIALLEDIADAAISGIGYWASRIEKVTDPDTGDTIKIIITDSLEEIEHTVTMERLHEGFMRLAEMFASRPIAHSNRYHFRACTAYMGCVYMNDFTALDVDFDSKTADMIVQMACFGKLIYN